LLLCRRRKGQNEKTSKQFVILIKKQDGGMCACKQNGEIAFGKKQESKGGKCAMGWVSTSLLSSAVAEEVTSQSFEDASSESFATE
jgi:hypothetical protein